MNFLSIIPLQLTETEIVKISLRYPERVPYPFKVYTTDKLIGVESNTRYQGYIIVMRVHPCDVLGEGNHEPFQFKAHLYSTTEIVIEVPVLDFTDMGKDDDLVRELFSADADSDEEENTMAKEDYVLLEALDVGRNKLNDRINNKVFPIKKQYRVLFDDDVQLSSAVLKIHEPFKDSSRLMLRPLPIDYCLGNMQKPFEESLTWADINQTDMTLRISDDELINEQRRVSTLPVKMMVVTRLCIEMADLNKEHRKKGKIVSKSADVSGAEAMMAAMSMKKKKKKATS